MLRNVRSALFTSVETPSVKLVSFRLLYATFQLHHIHHTTRLQLFHFCSLLSHGTSCRVHLLLKTLCVVTNVVLWQHHALIMCVCPRIAHPNVTHLACSSIGQALEWIYTRELLCFPSWSGSRYLFRCWHCSHGAESMTALFQAFPTFEHEASLLPPPLPTNTLLFLQKCHKDTWLCTWDALALSRSNCKIFRSLFTLSAVGQSCRGGVLKAFPDHCAPPLYLLLAIILGHRETVGHV